MQMMDAKKVDKESYSEGHHKKDYWQTERNLFLSIYNTNVSPKKSTLKFVQEETY